MKKLLLMLFGLLMALPAVAAVGDEISYTYEGQTLKYTILNEDAKTVQVKAGIKSTEGVEGYIPGNNVTGDLVIPGTVENDGTEYTVTAIGEKAFFMNSGLTSARIEAEVTAIPLSAFFRCENLISVTIPNSVTSIGNSAFSSCTSLPAVTIPASVTEIGAFAFALCSSLSEVTSLAVVAPKSNSAFTSNDKPDELYNKVNLIVPQSGVDSYIYATGEWSKFVNISTLEGTKYNIITEGNGLRYRVVSDNSAVLIKGDYTGLTEAVIPATLSDNEKSYSVTQILSDVFQKCSNLTSVTIPETVISIGSYAFNECGLTSVSIPASVTSLGNCAFMRCENLESVESLGSITSIGDNTFARCYKLKSLEIPNSVTSIGGSAFSLCYSLESVTFSENLTSIATLAFSDCTGLKSVTIPASVTSIEDYAFRGCHNIKEVVLQGDNPPSVNANAFSSSEGIPPIYTTAALKVPDDCLGKYLASNWSCFTDMSTMSGVKPISFSNGGINYKVIGESSVMLVGVTDSDMTTVPNLEEVVDGGKTYSVTTIGKEAFSGCSNITSMDLPSSLTYIDDLAFCECSGLESLTIPENVTGIGNYAFSDCSGLVSMKIPESVTYIGSEVFERCINLRLLDMSAITLPNFSSVVSKLTAYPMIYVKAGTEGTAGRANVVVGDNCENFVINYGTAANNQLLLSVPHKFTAENVTINRTFTKDNPATLYLPFELVVDNYGTFYTGGTYNETEQMVYFREVKDPTTTPNTPYMLIPNQNFSSITLENVGVCVTPEDVEIDGFNGVYAMKAFNEDEVASKLYYGWANGEFCWAAEGAKIDACRAYFKLPASAAAKAPASLKASFGKPDGTTAVGDINTDWEADDVPVYNVSGQRVGSNYKGIVIKKGRKTIK